MDRRVFGIETEFGCFVRDPVYGDSDGVVEAIRDYAFHERRIGVIDKHTRDHAFEPAGAGGFLRSGGRLYVDAVGSHEEYATPECTSLWDLVAHDRAGRMLLQSFLQDLEMEDAVSFHNNSVDHFGGHTFGCHENYLIQVGDDAFAAALGHLLPFLVTRQIFAGVGRVGGHLLTRPSSESNIMTYSEHDVDYVWVSNFYGVEIDPSVDFQLSQRADHIVKVISGRVRFNRAIINPKWDSYFSYSDLHRLHVLFGESNMSEYATALKIGTTSLVLDLIEGQMAPDGLDLKEPLWALREVSRDPTMRWVVKLRSGKTIGAVDLHRIYLRAAQRYLSRRDDQTDWILREWERTLDDLERDPLSTSDRLDWSAKKVLYSEYIEAEGGSWQDDIMQSLDLEYHNIDPRVGLHAGLEQDGRMVRLVDDLRVVAAMTKPPIDTRAFGRSIIVGELLERPEMLYVIDWDGAYIEPKRQLEMKDPFKTYEREAHKLMRSSG